MDSEEIEKDLNGREIEKGRIPSVGTRIVILGNTWQVMYARENPDRISMELLERYKKK